MEHIKTKTKQPITRITKLISIVTSGKIINTCLKKVPNIKENTNNRYPNSPLTFSINYHPIHISPVI